MTDFRTLPVDEALAWIRAWTDHAWPITLPQAFTIRDSLGWIPSPQEPRYFTTKLSINGRENGIISRSNEFGIKGINFNLTSTPAKENDENIRISQVAYSQYVSSMECLWGSGRPGKNQFGSPQISWILANKVSISMIRVDTLIRIDIESPWLTQITEEYDRAMEDYE